MLNKLKLLILDVDGVLTDGTKVYNTEGKAIHKRFNDKDFTAIKRFKAAGVTVVFLSGDVNVNEGVAKQRDIPFYYSRVNGILDKADFIDKFKKIYKVKEEEMAFVGDDFFDLDITSRLRRNSFCPADAIDELKEECRLVLRTNGGEGVIAELFYIFKEYNIDRVNDALVHNLDKNEPASK
jgi:3-deoxy-D-manno-octulosonate 8-phosphate phosphatase (KDO 8-P phosphatase)